jgi:hypothetical protein
VLGERVEDIRGEDEAEEEEDLVEVGDKLFATIVDTRTLRVRVYESDMPVMSILYSV